MKKTAIPMAWAHRAATLWDRTEGAYIVKGQPGMQKSQLHI